MVQKIAESGELQHIIDSAGDKLVVVDFFAEWCGPCRRIAPEIAKWETQYGNVIFVKVDVDDEDCSEAVERYHIEAMPTFKIFKGGIEVESIQGANAKAILAAIEKLGGDTRRVMTAEKRALIEARERVLVVERQAAVAMEAAREAAERVRQIEAERERDAVLAAERQAAAAQEAERVRQVEAQRVGEIQAGLEARALAAERELAVAMERAREIERLRQLETQRLSQVQAGLEARALAAERQAAVAMQTAREEVRRSQSYGGLERSVTLVEDDVIEVMAAESVLVQLFSYDVLDRSSNHFSDELGSGGFGIVYAGAIQMRNHGSDRQGRSRLLQVAIKKLSRESMQGFAEVVREVSLLLSLRDAHIVPIIGICLEPLCIVYPLMSNGSLTDHLGSVVKRQSMSWQQRISILLQVACGLRFLHEQVRPVIHRDIKPHNVLLDGDMRARLSDFGIARLTSVEAASVTAGQGTFLYMCPKYRDERQLSPKSDIYSVGIVMMQVLAGRDHPLHLAHDIRQAVHNNTLNTMLDKECNWPEDIASAAAALALRCTTIEPVNRPSSGELATLLQQFQIHVAHEHSTIEELQLKECIICCERYRSVRFMPCGHFLCCRVCGGNTRQLQLCPSCRLPITSVQDWLDTQTNSVR